MGDISGDGKLAYGSEMSLVSPMFKNKMCQYAKPSGIVFFFLPGGQ